MIAKANRWALWIAVLYGLILAILFVPLLMAAQVSFADLKNTTAFVSFIKEKAGVLGEWQPWLVIAVLMLAQAALLMIPVAVNAGRPVKKSPIVFAIIASGMMMGLLCLGAFMTVIEVVKSSWLNGPGLAFLGVFAIIWLLWAWVFLRMSRNAEPKSMIEKICSISLKGSVLELLVAVPCHIYVRQRNECCAGAGTFYGLAFGLAVMLFSFGPGIFFLYAQRIKTLSPQR